MQTNYFGPRRVNRAFSKFLQRPGGRIVNVSSASGPYYCSGLRNSELKLYLTKPWTIPGGLAQLDEMASTTTTDDAYGASKAFLNAYTCLHAKLEPDLYINAVTPGFIQTDITQGMGATSPPSKGAVPPCFGILDESIERLPQGRYYGSDCVRSPIGFYRGPGEPPYTDDEDLAPLLESAQNAL